MKRVWNWFPCIVAVPSVRTFFSKHPELKEKYPQIKDRCPCLPNDRATDFYISVDGQNYYFVEIWTNVTHQRAEVSPALVRELANQALPILEEPGELQMCRWHDSETVHFRIEPINYMHTWRSLRIKQNLYWKCFGEACKVQILDYRERRKSAPLSQYDKYCIRLEKKRERLSAQSLKRDIRRVTNNNPEWTVKTFTTGGDVKAVIHRENGKWVERRCTGIAGKKEEVLKSYSLPLTKKEVLKYLRQYKSDGYRIYRNERYVDHI